MAGTSPAPKQGPQKQGLKSDPGLQQRLLHAVLHQLQIHGDGGRIHRQGEVAAAGIVARQNGGGLGDVVVHAAGTPGDDALIHHQLAVRQLVRQVQARLTAELGGGPLLHLPQVVAGIMEQFAERHRLGGVERQGGHGLHAVKVDGDHAVVVRAVLRVQGGERLGAAMEGQIVRHGFVRLPDGAETGRLRGHHVDADAVVHRQAGHGGTGELQHLVFHEAVLIRCAAQGDGHVVGADAAGRLAGEPHQNDLRRGDVVGVPQQLLDDLGTALPHAHGTQRAVARVAVGAKDHAAAAAHHLPGVLVDDGLVGGDVVTAVLHGGGQAEHVVVLVDGAAHGAQAVVAVGQHVGHREFRHAAGLSGLDDAHVGDVVGDETVKGQVQQAVPRRLVVAAEDLVGHGPVTQGRCGSLGGRRHPVLQGDAAVVQLDHMVTLLFGEFLTYHF